MVREVLGVLYVLGVLNALGIIKVLKVLGGSRHFKGSGDCGDGSVRWDAAECVLECLCRKLTEGS